MSIREKENKRNRECSVVSVDLRSNKKKKKKTNKGNKEGDTPSSRFKLLKVSNNVSHGMGQRRRLTDSRHSTAA